MSDYVFGWESTLYCNGTELSQTTLRVGIDYTEMWIKLLCTSYIGIAMLARYDFSILDLVYVVVTMISLYAFIL